MRTVEPKFQRRGVGEPTSARVAPDASASFATKGMYKRIGLAPVVQKD